MQDSVGSLLAQNKTTVTIVLLPPPLPSLACHYLAAATKHGWPLPRIRKDRMLISEGSQGNFLLVSNSYL